MEPIKKQGRHFVLVHGACHGAWCWYKLKPLLEAAGHKVTALDLAASGIDLRKIEQLHTFHDYTLPLMESLPQEEKVILVGHSLGGMNLGIVMEKYPQKIYVVVFLAAFMPDSIHTSSYVLDQYFERMQTMNWLDTRFVSYGSPEEPLPSIFFGPKFLAYNLYQLCPPEDVALVSSLGRASSLFLEDLSKTKYLTDEGYGSVKKVYIVCTEDKLLPKEFQKWQIDNINSIIETKEIKGADHMAMLSVPKKLCDTLLEIADKYN
ncbi:salicylic acid-binding protein 2-like [Solanum pennellii]|uniref:Salicylic acid-binding protein 2-like n=1 Tax=Solanum pennellii TaxID=28526 RepID=A0ABM1G7M7_SOLPN|nr:salicylic acid-binding protein 2-like [Solanum pennellii]